LIYIDTSVLGAIFFREAGAADLLARLEGQRKKQLMISAWTLTEMVSVGGIKQRTGAIDAVTRQQALANFQRFASMHLGTVEIEPADFRTAAVLIESPSPLRAGDALHLAVARRLGAPLASIDRRLCVAVDALGLARFDLTQRKRG
jgi:predicted nucleic acid-binding protein